MSRKRICAECLRISTRGRANEYFRNMMFRGGTTLGGRQISTCRGDHVPYNNNRNSHIGKWGPIRIYMRGHRNSASSGDDGDHFPKQTRSSVVLANFVRHIDNNDNLETRHLGDHVPVNPRKPRDLATMSGISSGNNEYQVMGGADEEPEAEACEQ
jgi:hypothetical protein